MSSKKLYWRDLHSNYLSDKPVPCRKETLEAYLPKSAFRPDDRHGHALSLCEADATSEEDFLLSVRTENRKGGGKQQEFCAIAILSQSDLEENGLGNSVLFSLFFWGFGLF